MPKPFANRSSILAAAVLVVGGIALAALAIQRIPGANEGYRETVTIMTDDPRVAVISVSQFGKRVQAQGIGTPQVRFVTESDEDSIPCDTDDLEVQTSNNMTHYPSVNLCEAKWQIRLTTAVAPLPAGLRAEPALKWITAKLADAPFPTQALHYAVPETDGTLMTATCQPGTGRIIAKFTGSREALKNAPTARIDFYARSGVLRYDATVSRAPEIGAEETMPFEIEQSATSVFWISLAGGAAMPFRIQGGDFLILDATTRAAAIGEFIKICMVR